MGLSVSVSVYANPQGDCTGGDISSKTDDLCIVNIVGPLIPTMVQSLWGIGSPDSGKSCNSILLYRLEIFQRPSSITDRQNLPLSV